MEANVITDIYKLFKTFLVCSVHSQMIILKIFVQIAVFSIHAI